MEPFPADLAEPAPVPENTWGRPFLRFGVICSLFGPFLIALMWVAAWLTGDVDPQSWASWESNHGPWRHSDGLDATFGAALMMPIVGSLVAAPALFSERIGAAWGLICANVIFEILAVAGHVWLFD